MINLDKIGLRYNQDHEVLSNISLHLRAGSFHYLTGASGAGKSSLMRLIYMAQRPTRGNIKILGKDLSTVKPEIMPELRRQIGMVFQDNRLISHLTAFDNLALPLRIRGASESQIVEQVTELLEWVGLGEQMQQLPQTLSGGEQQRVAIARAIIAKPVILLADEPTGNLDEVTASHLMRFFQQMNEDGMTVLVATHSLSIMKRFPNPILHLKAGVIEIVDISQLEAEAR